MLNNKRHFAVFLFLIVSCGLPARRKWHGRIVEGRILNDSIFDGPIKFFDSEGNLTESRSYSNGLLNGEYCGFYNSGKKQYSIVYENGRENGFHYVYDTSGRLIYTDYYFHGISCGPVELRIHNKPSSYFFYSFGGSLLCSFQYDSAGNIVYRNDNDLFYMNMSSLKKGDENKFKLFVYTPHPPRILMNYNVVYLDSGKTVEIAKIPDSCVFYQTLLDTPRYGIQYALTLRYFDSTTGANHIFRKKILLDSLYPSLQKL